MNLMDGVERVECSAEIGLQTDEKRVVRSGLGGGDVCMV